MPTVGLEPANLASERLQIHALDHWDRVFIALQQQNETINNT